MKYNITSVEDIQHIHEAILKNEQVEIGEIKPIHFKIKLDGGRFTNYDPKFIDKFVAITILSQQANYEKMLKEIEKQYNVKIPDKSKLLKFELEKGSLELLTELPALMEVFKNMESIHQLYAVLSIAGGWFTYLGFSKYMENQQKEIELKSQEKLKELDGEERKRYSETVNKALVSMKEIANNVTLQKVINKPKEDLSTNLEANEVLTFNNDTEHKITNNSSQSFAYIPPQVDDIEEEIEDTYTIANYHFKSEEKYFKLDGISKLANSLAMPAAKRIKLLSKAEKQESVKLKLKIIRDGLSKNIKQIFILDYIE